MVAQLEVNEINSRTFKDFYWFSRTGRSGIFFPIQGLSRIFKARGQGVLRSVILPVIVPINQLISRIHYWIYNISQSLENQIQFNLIEK
jgi:hypothetical protein